MGRSPRTAIRRFIGELGPTASRLWKDPAEGRKEIVRRPECEPNSAKDLGGDDRGRKDRDVGDRNGKENAGPERTAGLAATDPGTTGAGNRYGNMLATKRGADMLRFPE